MKPDQSLISALTLTQNLSILDLNLDIKEVCDWKIGQAKQNFSEVVHAAKKEPQIIYKREKMLAIVLDSKSYKDFLRFKKSKSKNTISSEFEKLRKLCDKERILKTPQRKKRKVILA